MENMEKETRKKEVTFQSLLVFGYVVAAVLVMTGKSHLGEVGSLFAATLYVALVVLTYLKSLETSSGKMVVVQIGTGILFAVGMGLLVKPYAESSLEAVAVTFPVTYFATYLAVTAIEQLRKK